MNQIYSHSSLTVSHIIEEIDSGRWGLPELQRPFIWKDSKVRDLFDSIMRGYPIGYLMVWQCPLSEKNRIVGTEKKSYDSPQEVIKDNVK